MEKTIQIIGVFLVVKIINKILDIYVKVLGDVFIGGIYIE